MQTRGIDLDAAVQTAGRRLRSADLLRLREPDVCARRHDRRAEGAVRAVRLRRRGDCCKDRQSKDGGTHSEVERAERWRVS